MARPSPLVLALLAPLGLGAPALPAERATPPATLVAKLRNEEVPSAVWTQIAALGKQAVPELKRLAAGDNPLARARAALLLYRLGDTQALDLLSGLLESKDRAARHEAATALLAFVGAPLHFDAAAPPDQRARAVVHWKTWWEANRKDALALPPASRLYGKVLAADPSADLVAITLAARHGAQKDMQLTVVRGSQPVCSLRLERPGRSSSIARIIPFSQRVPPQAGDLAFFIRR